MNLQSLNQISIPVPCHENWDAMTEAEKGRFCAVCQKTVIDFSQMNETEIIHTLNEKLKTESVCGRFHKNQISVTTSWTQKISQKMRYFALALLIAFGIPKISKAQLHEDPKEQHYLKGDVGLEQTGSLSGTVKNKANNIVLSGATVQIWYNNQLLSTVKTNGNGFYEFKSLEAGVYMLKVYATNYVPYAIKELHIIQNKNIVADIELNKTPKPTKPYNENHHKVGKIHVQDNR